MLCFSYSRTLLIHLDTAFCGSDLPKYLKKKIWLKSNSRKESLQICKGSFLTNCKLFKRKPWWPLILSLWNKTKLFYLQFQHWTVPKPFSPLTASAIHHGFFLCWGDFSFSFINYFLFSCWNKKVKCILKQKHQTFLLRLTFDKQYVCSGFCETKLERSGYLTRAYVNVWKSQTAVF